VFFNANSEGFMKSIRFFSIFPVLLALALFFPGCEDGPPPDGGSGPGVTPPATNGSLYYAKSGGKHVFLSIYTPKNKAVSNGDSYAVAVVTVNATDESDYTEPKSEGIVSVSGSKLTFTPSSEYTGGGTGTLSGNIITMDEVPGTSYTNLEMELLTNMSATPSSPFGPGGPIPPSDTSPGTPNTPPVATGGDFVPGRIVKSIEVLTQPNWGVLGEDKSKTSAGIYYFEGDPISPNNRGMQVLVTFSDNTTYIVQQHEITNWFVIDPPYYHNGGSSNHTLYYINGFTNSNTGSAATSQKFTGPGQTAAEGGVLIKINSDSAKLDSGKLWIKYPGDKIIPEWYEDDQFFYATATLELLYGWSTLETKLDATNAKSFMPDSVKNQRDFPNSSDVSTRWYAPPVPQNYPVTLSGNTLTLKYGDQTADFKVPNIYHVSKIALSGQPKFAEQILFDDPRLFGGLISSTINAHWLSKIQDVYLNVSYKEGKTRALSMVTAYNNAGYYASVNKHSFLEPPSGSNLSKVALGFRYYGAEAIACEVPMFNTLLSISIVGTPAANPVMYHTQSGGVVNELLPHFMGKVAIYAVYECGKNGVTVRRTDAWGQSQQSGKAGDNASCSSTFESDVNSIDFLKRATLTYSNGQKLTRARVTFKPYRDNGVPKSNTIEIGAVGYL
jgi:hypothetical protein